MSKLAERPLRPSPLSGGSWSSEVDSLSPVRDYLDPQMPNAASSSREVEYYLMRYDTTETRPAFVTRIRFNTLASALFKETKHLGNPARILERPIYAEIKAMGEAVIPLIFSRIDNEPNLWLVALSDITGKSPVKRWNEGKVSRMVSDWKKWAMSQGILQ